MVVEQRFFDCKLVTRDIHLAALFFPTTPLRMLGKYFPSWRKHFNFVVCPLCSFQLFAQKPFYLLNIFTVFVFNFRLLLFVFVAPPLLNALFPLYSHRLFSKCDAHTRDHGSHLSRAAAVWPSLSLSKTQTSVTIKLELRWISGVRALLKYMEHFTTFTNSVSKHSGVYCISSVSTLRCTTVALNGTILSLPQSSPPKKKASKRIEAFESAFMELWTWIHCHIRCRKSAISLLICRKKTISLVFKNCQT